MTAHIGFAIHHFLVCQNRFEFRTPPDWFFVDVCKSALEEFQEDPLGPFVIARIRGVDLPIPIDGESDALDLTTEIIDVCLGRFRWMGSRLDCILLGRKTECIPTHRVQDVETAGLPVTGQDVRGDVALGMPDVQAGARRVGEHVQGIVLWLVRSIFRAEGLFAFPKLLPSTFDGGEIVFLFVFGHFKKKKDNEPFSPLWQRERGGLSRSCFLLKL